jgi:hydroxymethylbilane synthase
MIMRIGTRGSQLALAQSEWVKDRIEARHSNMRVEVVKIRTTGDKILDSPLSTIGGKGLFVKEIEEALLRKQVDVAVHSMKDVPAELPDELILRTFPEREDPRDVLITRGGQTLEELAPGSRVGTSSLRRAAQLRHWRPDLNLEPLRGNVDTRLRKLAAGEFEAIVLAKAGLMRLGHHNRITQVLPETKVLPAIGQGALALEMRREDRALPPLLDFLNHIPTEMTVRAERAFLRELEGGCQVPIAALARLSPRGLELDGMVAELDGSVLIRDRATAEAHRAEETGIMLARKLLEAGADSILKRIYGKA